ncbi:hypothetical protein MKY87_15355 [Paenibacillus sp. FSL R7-0198]|uniref:hypothetical protein n=1 Tax=Paenibacillus TaxID=44249 RepID=UPI001BEB8C5E|nr:MULTISPECIES: hypothetical protein [Paenibacillus]MBT2284933.1 hypothetical protein [Paenibacillus polymyxa]MCW3793249.1 hypothetical protein [Paenibacillus sp. LS1]
MSIGLFRYNGDINDRNSELTLSENISTQDFYEEHWEKAIHELGITIIQDGSEINYSQLEAAIVELALLKEWSIKNLDGNDLEYMKGRIENLQKVLPNAFINEDTVLYIF